MHAKPARVAMAGFHAWAWRRVRCTAIRTSSRWGKASASVFADQVLTAPRQEYTRSLIDASPERDWDFQQFRSVQTPLAPAAA